jgi:hypothetical protein
MRLVPADHADEEPGEDGGQDLRRDVGAELVRGHPATHEDPRAHRGVVVAAGYMTAGEDQHHQHAADRQRRQNARAGLVRRHAHGEDEQEHPDELDGQLAFERRSHACSVLSVVRTSRCSTRRVDALR